MPGRREPLDVRMSDATLHRFPLSRVDDHVAIAIHAHSRHFDVGKHGAQVCAAKRGDRKQEGFESGAGEVTIILDDWERADLTKATLSQAVHAGAEVLTWGEISPEFKGHLEQDNAVSRLVSGIILLIVVLGVASAKRSPQLPDVPTIGEAGVPGFEAENWFGMFAPAQTPKRIIARLNEALVKVVRSPEIQKQFAALGADPVGNSPEEFAAFVRRDMEKYAKVVRISGAKLD